MYACSANQAAPWFDKHLVEQFPGSLKNVATRSTEAHLYDRPATYAKIYVRYGEEKYLLAALRSNDFATKHHHGDNPDCGYCKDIREQFASLRSENAAPAGGSSRWYRFRRVRPHAGAIEPARYATGDDRDVACSSP